MVELGLSLPPGQSPPLLPPRWGEDVAPPPTPFAASPPSPPQEGRAAVDRRKRKCGHRHDLHQGLKNAGTAPVAEVAKSRSRSAAVRDMGGYVHVLPDDLRVITYAYRFAGRNASHILRDEIAFPSHVPEMTFSRRRKAYHTLHRLNKHSLQRDAPFSDELDELCQAPPNSQSSSPAYTTTTTGSSPEIPHPTSPASPRIRSALRDASNKNVSAVKKSVQWLSDCKKGSFVPIASDGDRQTVKSQYSLENETERQRLELQAEGIRAQIRLDRNAMETRRCNLESLQRIENEMAGLGIANADSESPKQRQNQGASRQFPQPAKFHRVSMPGMNDALSNSGPVDVGFRQGLAHEDTTSTISFTSSNHSPQLGRVTSMDNKVESVESSIPVFSCQDMDRISKHFEAMSSSPDNCDSIRNGRPMETLVQILHFNPSEAVKARIKASTGDSLERPWRETRLRVSKTLHNIVHAHPRDKQCKREAKSLKLLEILRMYTDLLRDLKSAATITSSDQASDTHKLVNRGCGPLGVKIPAVGAQDFIIVLAGAGRDFNSRWPSSQQGEQMSSVQSNERLAVSLPSTNFVNYSQDGIACEDEGVLVRINIVETMAALMTRSREEKYRQPIVLLGGVPALAELIKVEREVHGASSTCNEYCFHFRKWVGATLTNLTCGDTNIKSFLCSFDGFLRVMVEQLIDSQNGNDSLTKTMAQLFRNLAWETDKQSQVLLSSSNVVPVLVNSAIRLFASINNRTLPQVEEGQTIEGQKAQDKKEETLERMLSALWNLSPLCRKNKADICAVEGSLPLLVNLLQHSSVKIVENAGGILSNLSTYIATSEEGHYYRDILRDHNCLAILLDQLSSSSLVIVRSACETLRNLSARCSKNQELLLKLGAVPRLQALRNSKHKTIARNAEAALKSLTGSRSQLPPFGGDQEFDGSYGGEKRQEPQMHLQSLETPKAQSNGNRLTDGYHNAYVDDDLSKDKDIPHAKHFIPDTGGTRYPLKLSTGQHRSFLKRGNFDCPVPTYAIDACRAWPDQASAVFEPERHNSSPASWTGGSHREENIMSASSLFTFEAKEEEDPDLGADDYEEEPTDFSAKYADNEDQAEENDNGAKQLEDDEGDDEDLEGPKMQKMSEAEANQAIPLFTKRMAKPESGIMTPGSDRPRTFYTEITPNCLSVAESLSSLSSTDEARDSSYLTSTGNVTTDLQEMDVTKALPASADEKLPKLGSGMITPGSDRPRLFCTEITPACLSVAESVGSLESDKEALLVDKPLVNKGSEPVKQEESEGVVENSQVEANEPKDEISLHRCSIPQPARDTRNVTSSQHETPLIFSRKSSFESLNSELLHSVKDDYSSCEISRTTTRPVSPSDLPDSPCQTRPETPKQSKHAANDASQGQGLKRQHFGSEASPQLSSLQQPVNDFENFQLEDIEAGGNDASSSPLTEEVRVFQEEGTPAVYSSASSLSKFESTSGVYEAKGQSFQQGVDESQEAASAGMTRTEEEEEVSSDAIMQKMMLLGKPKTSSKPPKRCPSQGSRRNDKTPTSKLVAPKHLSNCQQPRLWNQTQGSDENRVENAHGEENFGSLDDDDDDDNDDFLAEITARGMPANQKRNHPLGVRTGAEGAPARDNKPQSGQRQQQHAFVGSKGQRHDGQDAQRSGQPLRLDKKQKSKIPSAAPAKRLGATPPSFRSPCDPTTVSGMGTPKVSVSEETPRSISTNSLGEMEMEKTAFTASKRRPDLNSDRGSPNDSSWLRNNAAGQHRPPARDEHRGDQSDDEDIYLKCISSGMPKSRSEPLNLKKKLEKSTQPRNVRSSSKSPRAPKVIPGVPIKNLQLKPRTSQALSPEDVLADPNDVMEATLIPDRGDIAKDISETLDSGILATSTDEKDEPSMLESVCSDLGSIQPPSIMDSVMSISDCNNSKPTSTASVQGKRVPEIIRRAIGDDVFTMSGSSVSSCQSNIDSIQPPSLMDDMSTSTFSVSSINKDTNGNPDSLDNINPPTLMEDVSRALDLSKTLMADNLPKEDATYIIDSKGGDDDSQSTCQDITDVFEEDTLVEPSSLTMESGDGREDTYVVPDLPRDSKKNTPIHSEGESSKESSPKKMMNYYKHFRVPLPDIETDFSEQLQHETTSGYKSDTTIASITPGPPSNESLNKADGKSSVQRRKDESDRFKTHTISKEELPGNRNTSKLACFVREKGSNSNLLQSGSPKSVKQRREEEAERFRTQVITAKDLVQKTVAAPEVTLSPMETKLIAGDARVVAEKIGSSSEHLIDRGRSASVDDVLDKTMSLSNAMEVSGSSPDLQKETIHGPRIAKPYEKKSDSKHEHIESPKRGIRGRRKLLYQAPTPPTSKRPPAISAKPAIAPKPRNVVSNVEVKGTRTSNLRNASCASSPKAAPQQLRNFGSPTSTMSSRSSASSSSRGNYSLSKASSSSSKSIGQSQKVTKPSLVRQGTFTKEESSSSNLSGEESGQATKSKTSSMRRDIVHPTAPRQQEISGTPPKVGGPSPRKSTTRKNPSSPSSRLQKPSFSSSNTSLASTRSTRSVSSARSQPSVSRTSSASVTSTPLSSTTVQQENSLSRKKVGKSRESMSKIVNLWKKVEESKKKGKEKDPRLWLTQGKVIPQEELALLKVHEEQRQIINSFQQAKSSAAATPATPGHDDSSNSQADVVRMRSRSKLSLKLSKFSSRPSKSSPTKSPVISPSPSDKSPSVGTDESQSKRLSRLGSFVNPPVDNESKNHVGLPVAASPRSHEAYPSFNYRGRHQFSSRSSSSTDKNRLSTAQVRRNDSYISSMGRRPGDADDGDDHNVSRDANSNKRKETYQATSPSSSALVTLV